VVEFKIDHESEQDEAGARRKVHTEMNAVAFEAQARLIAGATLGTSLVLQGFLSAKSQRSRKPVLHVTHIEFAEGEKDAPAA
jgi:primosomal replication protein N